MIDPEFLEIRKAFSIESAELLIEMESALLALEGNSARLDEFNRLFRAVHTIKGSASIVTFQEVEYFCHNIEHLLVRVRDHELSLNQKLIFLLLQCHDHISAMIDQYSVYLDFKNGFILPPTHAVLLSQLQEWENSISVKQVENLKYGLLQEIDLPDENESAPTALNLFHNIDDTHQEQLLDGASRKPSSLVAKNVEKQSIMRVDAAKVDQLSDLVVELVTAASVLEAHVRQLGDLLSTESAARVASLIKQVQGQAMSLRMVPVQTIFIRFKRIVNDMCRSTGKQIQLQVSGGETELDKTIAEKLHEPLLHLVRNAIDHGIEDTSLRVVHGKPPAGTIHLQAFLDSGKIVIRVSDDGQGINLKTIARKALEKGLIKDNTQSPSISILSHIFEPGFSTIEDATMLSGRGVGMDVVSKFVDSIRGRIDIETNEGIGTTFQVTIPLSLSLVDGFMLSLGSNLYILPMDLVQETMELPTAEHLATMPSGCLQVRGHILPCIDLRKVLQVTEPMPPVQHVVVFKHAGVGVCLIVDLLHGEIKTVIKPLGHLYRNVKFISGASILGDGSIALYLETEILVELAKNLA